MYKIIMEITEMLKHQKEYAEQYRRQRRDYKKQYMDKYKKPKKTVVYFFYADSI
jgi:hypothetical protein